MNSNTSFGALKEPVKDDPATMKLIERLDFVRRRPQYNHYIGTLLATVSSCGDFGKVIPDFTLEEAHQHIYGGTGCEWCRVNFAEAKKNHERAYNRPAVPADSI